MFDALGADTYVINNKPNGLNINLNAGSTHIEGLQKFVVENHLDIGFAYDGDADRCLCVSYFVYAFLNPDKGLMNTIIQFFGGDKIMWYSQPKWWPLILTFMQVWKSMGYNMVVYLASITGIDSTLYEAATLDGATKWQQTKYVTLPALKPIIVMMFILNVGHIFYSDFGLFYQVTQGVPNSLYNVASTFDTYVYQALQSNVTIGRTAAAGLFQAACCCATVLVANFIVSKIDEESAII